MLFQDSLPCSVSSVWNFSIFLSLEMMLVDCHKLTNLSQCVDQMPNFNLLGDYNLKSLCLDFSDGVTLPWFDFDKEAKVYTGYNVL